MKRILSVLLCLLLSAALLNGCGRLPEPTYRVAVASDLHYLAPELTDHGDIFRQMMANSDGKMTEFCEEITDAFLAELIELRPEALILTGDISFNGAQESHLALAKKLAALEAAGIPVLVLPGNHDVYRSSASYIGSETARATVTTSEDFRRIYAAFGYDEARAEDGDSLSYVYDLNATTRVLMLDCNTMHDPCGLSDETLAWIERQLKEARRDGVDILAAGHQNLYKHSFFGFGYVLVEGEELAALLRKYDVPLFLSGHLHIQHILTEDGLTEITTSPLTMGVCRYALLEAQQGALSYETRPVDVAAWAAQKGSTDERLLRFAESSYEAMAARIRVNVAEQFAGELAAEELERLTAYAVELNWEYFAGDLRGVEELDPDASLLAAWNDKGGLFSAYFGSVEPDFGRDFTSWKSD